MALSPCPKDLQRVASLLFHNGFGFQSPDTGLDKDCFVICKFVKYFSASDLEVIKAKSGSSTVHLIDWIGYNFLQVHWTEYNLIPEILTAFLNLDYGFETMNKFKAPFHLSNAGEFTFELMEIKGINGARRLLDEFNYPVDNLHPSLLDIWNYKTPEGVEFCKYARQKGGLDPPSYESPENYYNWAPFTGFDLEKYKWFPLVRPSAKVADPIVIEAAEECMICLDKTADTIVSPCGHCVVCKECSIGLRDTNDKNTCVRCRREITGISE